jgi:hypothetical protein
LLDVNVNQKTNDFSLKDNTDMDNPERNIAPIDQNFFPGSNKHITRVGLGGEGILRTTGKDPQARVVINEAVNQGITYYDCARVYMDSEIYYGKFWQDHQKERESMDEVVLPRMHPHKVFTGCVSFIICCGLSGHDCY